MSGDAPHIAELHTADLKRVRAQGISKSINKWKPPDWNAKDDHVDFQGPLVLHRAWLFGILSVPCPVVTLSCKPDGGLTHVCLPFIELGGDRFRGIIEDMIESLGVLVWMVARTVYPDKVDARSVKLVRTPHKAEWKDDKDGLLWFNKACESGRIATTIVDTSRQKGARKRWYAYLGGGAVDKDQTAFLNGGGRAREGLGMGSLHPGGVLAAVMLQRVWHARVGRQAAHHLRERRGAE